MVLRFDHGSWTVADLLLSLHWKNFYLSVIFDQTETVIKAWQLQSTYKMIEILFKFYLKSCKWASKRDACHGCRPWFSMIYRRFKNTVSGVKSQKYFLVQFLFDKKLNVFIGRINPYNKNSCWTWDLNFSSS